MGYAVDLASTSGLTMSKITRRNLGLATAAAAASTVVAGHDSRGPSLAWDDRYDRYDALDLAELIRRGVASPAELLEQAIARTDAVESQLNAVPLKHYELARQRTRGRFQGPFAGVPFLLKDLGVQLEGTVTSGGSKSMAGLTAGADNEIVTRFKNAGLNIFGKTNTPEFGMAFTTEPTAYGPTRNPFALEHTAGGSSGGSAAAVAAGIVPIAHASDGGGSIRVPAAACGIFGYKPTRLRTPRGPDTALSPSAMSVSHVVSRTVRDSAAVLDVIAGYEPGAPFAAPGRDDGFLAATRRKPEPLRIALNLAVPDVKLDPECRQAVLDVADRLQGLGHEVEEAAPALDYDAINGAQTYLVLAEFSHGMVQLAGALGKPVRSLALEPLSHHFVQEGRKLSAADYLTHCQATYAAGAAMAAFQRRFDLVLQPVTVTPPPKLGVLNYQPDDDYRTYIERFRRYAAYTYLYNLTGQPSASIPAGLSRSGLPLAVMLSGRNGEDARLLHVCAQLEAAHPWFDTRPRIHRAS